MSRALPASAAPLALARQQPLDLLRLPPGRASARVIPAAPDIKGAVIPILENSAGPRVELVNGNS